MTPEALAELHATCFTTPRPWRAAEFAALLARESVFLVADKAGFALGQCAGAEVELLTLAVAPSARRAGLGRALMDRFHAEARARGASTALLEVAATNAPALALYAATGYSEIGRRRAYYHAPDGTRADALVLTRAL
ncbi:ribosomal protein S18-alanine N-acetyltransferase [Vannielia litorea]|uniref:[Ribosomal protein bS18]-alanine N-acetyltransferase n=1 Tax=Vannielia litorea TaxID=1217970 RepID=A0A1N6H332_9RHOB|nr:ribosomal protein S18-alanine N-acetyltransferase [Vannielia litorea]SIO14112.1 ribosomal-protein-alanine N-acetyltransferase [Vannielia litorea]